MERSLEPEVMDTQQEAVEYDAMDFTEVNAAFAQRVIELTPILPKANILDAGTGTARIPILIAQQRPAWQILGIDLAESMLAMGKNQVIKANLGQQIHLAVVDAKQMPYGDRLFDGVISNSLVHHLSDPLPFFREIRRVLRPDGFILLRDLLRPSSEAEVDRLVEAIGPEYNLHQAQLFRDSLRAAFTLEEIMQLAQQSGLEGVSLYQSSDRHWTIEREYLA